MSAETVPTTNVIEGFMPILEKVEAEPARETVAPAPNLCVQPVRFDVPTMNNWQPETPPAVLVMVTESPV
jgi:hypothetical protein